MRWLSDFSCSSSAATEPNSSLPIPIQWLRFILLSPCPQRLLSSTVDLLFLLLTIFFFTLHKLSTRTNRQEERADVTKPLIGNRRRNHQTTQKTGIFKTTLVTSILLSFCSFLLTVLSFFTTTSTSLVNTLFWLIHAVTNAVISVLILRSKTSNIPSPLRIYWVSNFAVTTLFTVTGILQLISVSAAGSSIFLFFFRVFNLRRIFWWSQELLPASSPPPAPSFLPEATSSSPSLSSSQTT